MFIVGLMGQELLRVERMSRERLPPGLASSLRRLFFAERLGMGNLSGSDNPGSIHTEAQNLLVPIHYGVLMGRKFLIFPPFYVSSWLIFRFACFRLDSSIK